MPVAERIHQQVQRLPKQLQREVLHFIEYLLTKAERERAAQNRDEEAGLSLALAMQGMEEEDTPDYSLSDLKEIFS